MMFRLLELAAFSIFFVFSFIKLSVSEFVDIDILTYIYYIVLIFFLANYYLIHKPTRINYLIFALMLSILWLSIIGSMGIRSEGFGFGKLRALSLSLLSIPIAIYMFRRNLLEAAVVVTTIFILILSVLFFNFATYDRMDPAWILNEIYLHGSFLAGFMVFLSIILRLPVIWPVILTACLVSLGGRGPFLSLLIVSMFLFTNFFFRVINSPKLKKRGVLFSLVSFPVLVSSTLYFVPNLFDRMLARWSVIFSTPGGGDSAESRIQHIYTSIAAFDSSPFIGIGIANYGLFMTGFHKDSKPHNFILEILAENGLIGGLPFLLCVALIFLKSIGNKTWPLVLYVLISLLISYSYANSNEFYFALALAIVFRSIKDRKNEDIRNHSMSSF